MMNLLIKRFRSDQIELLFCLMKQYRKILSGQGANNGQTNGDGQSMRADGFIILMDGCLNRERNESQPLYQVDLSSYTASGSDLFCINLIVGWGGERERERKTLM